MGGVLATVLLTVFALSVHAQTFTLRYTFTGWPKDGANPYAGLFVDAKGNLYGTTEFGGDVDYGYGIAFEVTGTGETVLHNFGKGTDGGFPYAGLVMDGKGNLYGTTTFGGGASEDGTVFRIDEKGRETVLYRFCPKNGCRDGETPVAALIGDAKGNLYGTTVYGGGAKRCGLYGCGTVFKMTETGKETALHIFTAGADGANPWAGLVMDAKGNLYGTTVGGGASNAGTVFKVSKSGKETVLYNFNAAMDGSGPLSGLVLDAKGNLYGTTVNGGASNAGTVYKLSQKGEKTVLYSFTGGADGANPYAGLVMDAKGNLYGTTFAGGASSRFGTVFKVSHSGKETVLYSFTGGSDGANPYASLIMDARGNLYGTTYEGGDWGVGTVFQLTP
jgi:uncharacterized repeat protein (TIGR03803 family)